MAPRTGITPTTARTCGQISTPFSRHRGEWKYRAMLRTENVDEIFTKSPVSLHVYPSVLETISSGMYPRHLEFHTVDSVKYLSESARR